MSSSESVEIPFIEMLCNKQNSLRSDYHEILSSSDFKNIKLSSTSEQQLFDSMTRWHTNSHVNEEEWLSLFYKIRSSLNVDFMEEPCTGFTDFLK